MPSDRDFVRTAAARTPPTASGRRWPSRSGTSPRRAADRAPGRRSPRRSCRDRPARCRAPSADPHARPLAGRRDVVAGQEQRSPRSRARSAARSRPRPAASTSIAADAGPPTNASLSGATRDPPLSIARVGRAGRVLGAGRLKIGSRQFQPDAGLQARPEAHEGDAAGAEDCARPAGPVRLVRHERRQTSVRVGKRRPLGIRR